MITMTAIGTVAEEELLIAGANECMRKPFKIDEFPEIVERVLNGSGK